MIIGKDNLEPKNFIYNKKENNQIPEKNNYIENYHLKNNDINNETAIADKSFAMLQERYKQGLITIDEFTKKCNHLNKIRQK